MQPFNITFIIKYHALHACFLIDVGIYIGIHLQEKTFIVQPNEHNTNVFHPLLLVLLRIYYPIIIVVCGNVFAFFSLKYHQWV